MLSRFLFSVSALQSKRDTRIIFNAEWDADVRALQVTELYEKT